MHDPSFALIVGAAAVALLLGMLLLLVRRGGKRLAEVVPEPAEEAPPPEPVALPEAVGPPDPLTRLKGLGPRAAAQLEALGIVRFDQLAALDPAQAAFVDSRMGAFAGRIARDRWVEQARYLAAGDIAGFEAEFGKLG